MKKTVTTALIIIVLLILGIGGYLYTQKKTTPSVSNQATVAPTNTPATGGNPVNQGTALSTLRSLVASGQTVTCNYTDTGTGASGTMKIANNQLRGDFQTTIQNTSTTSHIISDGKTMYLWSDAQGTQGMKYDISTMSTPGTTGQSPAGQSKTIDMDKQYNYQCTPWTVDTTLFTPPTNIQFQDLSQLMKTLVPKVNSAPGSTETNTPGNNPACSACSSLTGDAGIQCRKALNCN